VSNRDRENWGNSVTTEKGAVGEASAELAQEQAYVTMLYERLDAMRAGTARRLAEVHLGPTAQNDQGWSEREMFAQEYADRGAELDAAERNDVVLATTSSLFPGVDAQGADSPEAARVKGDAMMAGVLAKAVADLRQVPAATIEIKVDGTLYRLTPRICRQARADAEQAADPETGDPLPHNRARRTFIRAVIRELTRQRLRDHGGLRALQPGEEEELRAELADAPAIHRVLDVLWPGVAPEQLLARLYAEPGRLDLTDDQRAVIARDTPGPWTPADVPLLDELAELLGAAEAAGRAARQRDAADEAERAAQLEYADQLVSKLVSDGSIFVPRLEHDTFVSWIARRYNADDEPRGMLAERALRDRTWAYGHVIVDEAQELSAMDWRLVLRRCPARSMTVVGDLAQTAAPGGADSWAQVLDPFAAGRWRTARLTVNYRTPAPVMKLAAAVLPPGAVPPQSVRDSDESPWHADAGAADLADLVRREGELIGAGRVAVIAPPARVAGTAAALGLSPGPDLDAPVAVLTPGQSKGLEFDSVIIVDPAGIEQASPRGRADLYVALTRTTRRLGLVSHGEPPGGLTAVLDQPSGQRIGGRL
jgi:UvrD-like helicase C-terminal domain/PhoH-like protein